MLSSNDQICLLIMFMQFHVQHRAVKCKYVSDSIVICVILLYLELTNEYIYTTRCR